MIKKIVCLMFIISAMLTVESIAFAGGFNEKKCDTKYPIMLIHGFLLRDTTLGIDYWGNIPKRLMDEGAKEIVYGNQNAWDCMEDGATDIYKSIYKYFATHQDPDLKCGKINKLNLICHSQGAIEARLMLAIYGDENVFGVPLKKRIASLTSICGPLRGTNIVSFIEDAAYGLVGAENIKYIEFFISIIAMIEGDKHPECLGPLEMRPNRMEKINKFITAELGHDDLSSEGIKGIFCQSWAGFVKLPLTADPTIDVGHIILNSYGDIPNDGVVPEASVPFGIYHGHVAGNWWGPGIGHQAMVDRGLLGFFPGGTSGFDVPGFYIDHVVKELKNRGL